MTNKPTFIAYAVRNRGKGQSSIWNRVGAVWPHNSGDGLTVELDAYPVDGRIVLMPPKVEDGASPNRFESEGGAA